MAKTSEKGIKLICEFEGLRLDAYLCPAGVWTIGYGHTQGVKKGDRITKERAIELLKEDLVIYEAAVKRCVKVPLNQNQFDALVSFAFNLGTGALAKSTLLKKLNAKDYKGAAAEFDKWVKAGGKTLSGLVRRRKAERELFESFIEA